MRIDAPGDDKMKKCTNYLLTAAVFIIILVLLYGGSFGITAAFCLIGLVLGGHEGLTAGYMFLLDHLNLVSCLVYLIPAVVFIPWYIFASARKNRLASFASGQIKKLSPVSFVWTCILAYAVQHAVSIIIGFMAIILPRAVEAYSEMVDAAGMTQYSPAWIFAVVILPPLVEETVFRGLIMHYLKSAGICFWIVNLIQALLFGIYHGNLIQGLYAFCIGLLLGYLAVRYDSLIIPIVVHALFNLFGTAGVELESKLLPPLLQGMLTFACVPVTAMLLVLIHYGAGEKKNNNQCGEKRDVQ